MHHCFIRWMTAFAIMLTGGVAAYAELPKLSQRHIDFFAEKYGGPTIYSDRVLLLRHWQDDARRELKGRSIIEAAERLASIYGFSTVEMEEMLRLWLMADQVRFDLSEETQGTSQLQELHEKIADFVARTGYKELALQMAAYAMTPYGHCEEEDLIKLIDKTSNKIEIGWLAVQTSDCSAWKTSFLKIVGNRNIPVLYAIARYTGILFAEDDLALISWLNSNEALSHVAAADREIVQAYFAYRYFKAMMDIGMADEALAFYDHLPQGVKVLLLDSKLGLRLVHIDNLLVWLEAEGGGAESWQGDELVHETPSNADFRLYLAAALAVAGRNDEAVRIFDDIQLLSDIRAAKACKAAKSGLEKAKCPRMTENANTYLLLDHVLHHMGEDPYDLAEMVVSQLSTVSGKSAVWVDISCKVFAEMKGQTICQDNREEFASSYRMNDAGDKRAIQTSAALAAVIPAFAESSKTFLSKIDAAVSKYGTLVARNMVDNKSIDPMPARFEQLLLPESYRGTPENTSKTAFKDLAALPQGYEPVRIERDKNRIVAVSVSQNYDPTGEVSPGGYWVHLSKDGGKTWGRPLYTGLAAAFPYIVLSDSKMPLIDGDTLNIAVEIQLLDTASISYPPTTLRSRKQEKDLYLKVPIGDLMCDSDGDSLTDIAEKHLLLDPHNPDTDGDGLTDGVDPLPNVKQAFAITPEQKALQLVLEKIFSIRTGAIIQKTDRPASDIVGTMSSTVKRDPNSANRPIFVLGNPVDFASFTPDRMMLLYSSADIEKLQRMTPDFHALSFGNIVFNRSHTRGYFNWSLGWTGGMVRLQLEGDHWTMEEIRHWIT